jgi:uncharacterized membrane protein
MSGSLAVVNRRRGITVLALVLLIIVVVLAVIFLVRYLGQHQTAKTSLEPQRGEAWSITASSA